jgi:o-succinylbenzoate synthase
LADEAVLRRLTDMHATGFRLSIQPYRLPLTRPWRSARGDVRERVGWLVIASAEGMHGFGDCAPLPEAGTESPADAERRLSDWRALAPTLTGSDPVASMLQALSSVAADAASSPAPSADCAVESALLDLQARKRGLPLRRLLATAATDDIAVNASLGTAVALAPEQVSTACARGYRVLKIKVGNDAMAPELARILAAVPALSPGALLRLDANGAWDEDAAADFVAGLAGLPIDGIEEPLREPDDAALDRLQARAAFAIALDESLPRRPQPIDPAQLPVRRLVLKPGVLGGLRPTLRLARRARDAGREVVVTSLIESAAGLWATAQLAAATGSPLAHGLATGDWLARDLGRTPEPEAGRIALPETPGSGFEPTRSMS